MDKNKDKDKLMMELINILNDCHIFAEHISFLSDQSDHDHLAGALINVSLPAGRTLPIIRSVLQGEFKRNFREPSSIMRGNCVASKMMGNFCRK